MCELNGKAEPFLTTGGGAVPNNDGLVAALRRYVISCSLVDRLLNNVISDEG